MNNRLGEDMMMTVTPEAAARLAEMIGETIKNEGVGEKHVRLNVDSVT